MPSLITTMLTLAFNTTQKQWSVTTHLLFPYVKIVLILHATLTHISHVPMTTSQIGILLNTFPTSLMFPQFVYMWTRSYYPNPSYIINWFSDMQQLKVFIGKWIGKGNESSKCCFKFEFTHICLKDIDIVWHFFFPFERGDHKCRLHIFSQIERCKKT
jgi:hypothetical protein